MFWTLFGTEARRHDDAWINTLKDDLDGTLMPFRNCYLIFVNGVSLCAIHRRGSGHDWSKHNNSLNTDSFRL
jgi:hypothetical protein